MGRMLRSVEMRRRRRKRTRRQTIGAIFFAAAVLMTPLAISIAAVASSDGVPVRVDDGKPVPAPYDFHDEYFDYE